MVRHLRMRNRHPKRVTLRHTATAHDRSMKLTRRRRTDLVAAVESALIGMMTAFWLTRRLRRGWRVAR
jgi:hypothetical protein